MKDEERKKLLASSPTPSNSSEPYHRNTCIMNRNRLSINSDFDDKDYKKSVQLPLNIDIKIGTDNDIDDVRETTSSHEMSFNSSTRA